MPEADRLFLTLMRDIARSPDLITDDRNALMQTYMANYQQEKANHVTATAMLKAHSRKAVRRGAATENAVAAVQRAAGLIKKSAIPKPAGELVRTGLQRLSLCWSEIPHLQEREHSFNLDKTALYDQFNAVKATQKETAMDPKALADAISFAAFH